MELARQRLQKILNNCKEKGIDPGGIKEVREFLKNSKTEKVCQWERRIKFGLAMVAVVYCVNYYFNELQSKECLLHLPGSMRYVFRPPENCDFCSGVERVDRLSGITSAEFEEKYAYSGSPVVITDATSNWTALTKFSYNFFRDVYRNAKRKQKILNCQFLPYTTGFRNIFEALNMPEERVQLQPGSEPWYFGWSNCNPETAEEFRKHYGRPYFLPATSENNNVDWFFIGTSGLGAHMHVDNVRLPSWQAQLSGSKQWILAPPPECYFQCNRLEVIVEKGDIIVLDTNKWYHQTFVQPGQISLTIGAEYD